MNKLILASILLSSAACSNRLDEQIDSVSLLEAAEQGDRQQVIRLLDEKQPVDMRDACMFTPLMKATLNGHLHTVNALVQAGAEIDLQDKGGYTAMMLAASNNFVELVDYLIEQGAEVDHIEKTHGWSALIWAANRGHADTVKHLLQHHANPDLRDHDGLSAADHARRGGHEAVLLLLQNPPGKA